MQSGAQCGVPSVSWLLCEVKLRQCWNLAPSCFRFFSWHVCEVRPRQGWNQTRGPFRALVSLWGQAQAGLSKTVFLVWAAVVKGILATERETNMASGSFPSFLISPHPFNGWQRAQKEFQLGGLMPSWWLPSWCWHPCSLVTTSVRLFFSAWVLKCYASLKLLISNSCDQNDN